LCVVELDKPCYCNLKVVNNSEYHVAFKVRGISISWWCTTLNFLLAFWWNLVTRFRLDQTFVSFPSGQDDISEEVFRQAERERRPAVGFLHDNK
jgi:hypothetical protein